MTDEEERIVQNAVIYGFESYRSVLASMMDLIKGQMDLTKDLIARVDLLEVEILRRRDSDAPS